MLGMVSCGGQAEVLHAGGVYSVVSEGGQFGVVKVLKVEANAVHVRLYSGKWKSRPTISTLGELRLGTIHEADPGVGHLPLSPRAFAAWAPKLIFISEVAEAELDGYREWNDAGGGVWGQ
jgi:hypothetical protein